MRIGIPAAYFSPGRDPAEGDLVWLDALRQRVITATRATDARLLAMDAQSQATDHQPRMGLQTLALLLGPSTIAPLSMWARNAERNVNVAALIGAGLLTFVIAAAGAFVVRKPAIGRVLAIQIGVLGFWSWSAVPADLFPSAAMDVAFGLLSVAAAAWIALHLASFEWLPQVLGVGFGVAAVSMLATGLIVGDATPPDPPAPAELSDALPGRDLVILILDAHTSPSVLADVFDYDMSPITSGLEQRGFTVVESAASNYTMTHFSVPSVLLLDYWVEPGFDGLPSLPRLGRRMVAGDAGLMAWMSEIGYSVTKFESGWEEDSCGDVSRCIPAGWRGDVTAWLLAARTPFRSLWPSHPYPTTAIGVLGDLPAAVADAAANGRPDFIMAHVLSPHSPLFVTADCRNRYVFGFGGVNIGSPDMPDHVAEARSRAYAEQVECVGTHLITLASALAGTDTVVLVAGDHGSDIDGQTWFPLEDWTAAQLEERFSVFAAVRVPFTCGPAPDSLVNLARFAVGCALTTDVPMLPDRFFGSGGANAPLVDVTQRVSRLRDETIQSGG